MSLAVFYKLLSILMTMALGFAAGRARWLGGEAGMQALAGAAQYLFLPALLFRATSHIAFAQLPMGMLAAYFVPVLLAMCAVYAWFRRLHPQGPEVAVPGVRAMSLGFGNSVQLGIPVAMALYAEAGLGIHLMLVSVHALILLTTVTVFTETALAQERRRMNLAGSAWGTFGTTLKSALVHPVVTPVLAGLAFNALGGVLPPMVDEWLQMLGAGVVPVCLVLVGLSLAHHGRAGLTRQAATLALAKLLLLPAVVLVSCYLVFGLRGLPLNVLVMAAALPSGNNALMFSQRYRTLEAETASAVVLSSLGYALAMPLWLWVLHLLS